jgi:hypothetical protein
MPQIWMTDEELAAMLDCSASEARERVLLERLDRKISRDGNKRSKLNGELTAVFVERLRTMDGMIEQQIDHLRRVHALLCEADQPKIPPSTARRLTAQ